MSKQKDTVVNVDKTVTFKKNLIKLIDSLRNVEKGLALSGDLKTLSKMVSHRELLTMIVDSIPQ